jgi:hypothetical protein
MSSGKNIINKYKLPQRHKLLCEKSFWFFFFRKRIKVKHQISEQLTASLVENFTFFTKLAEPSSHLSNLVIFYWCSFLFFFLRGKRKETEPKKRKTRFSLPRVIRALPRTPFSVSLGFNVAKLRKRKPPIEMGGEH